MQLISFLEAVKASRAKVLAMYFGLSVVLVLTNINTAIGQSVSDSTQKFDSTWVPSFNTDVKPKVGRKVVDIKNVNLENYQYLIKKTTDVIKLDGIADEDAWLTADSLGQFYQNYPFDSGYAKSITNVKMLYNDGFLYVSAKCYTPANGKFITQSLSRDWNHRDTDGFQIILDPLSDKTNGFVFGVSAYGAQREGLIINGGNESVNLNWDNKWQSSVRHGIGYFEVEMAIPFSTLRYKVGLTEWRMNFTRMDYQRNELSTWVPMFRNFSIHNLGSTGTLVWQQPLTATGRNVSLIPYVTARSDRSVVEGKAMALTSQTGLDAKIGVTNSLNLDLTLNPDFSQVDVDRNQANLSRFELFFPEKRTFFLENADLFDRFGSSDIKPFFSRRIGIRYNKNIGVYQQNPIYLGARLSGKLNKDYRIGALAALTPNNQGAGSQGQAYSMLAVQRRILARSNIGGFVTNRTATGADSVLFMKDGIQANSNTVGGLQFNYASSDNRVRGSSFGMLSATKQAQAQTYAHASDYSYNDRHLSIEAYYSAVGQNFSTDLGYTPRKGYLQPGVSFGYNFLPKKSDFLASQSVTMGCEYTFTNNIDGFSDRNLYFEYDIAFLNTSYLSGSVASNYVKLFTGFDPTNTDKPQLAAGNAYNNNNLKLTYTSDIRRPVFGTVALQEGGYYSGRLRSANGAINFRSLPKLIVGVDFTYNQISLPGPYGITNLYIVGPNVNYSVSNNIFFKAYWQLNNQVNNINFNARLQWRYKPASDVFLVYTDNYYANTYGTKTRTLVLKITYWLNT